jgi:hypothetical protein
MDLADALRQIMGNLSPGLDPVLSWHRLYSLNKLLPYLLPLAQVQRTKLWTDSMHTFQTEETDGEGIANGPGGKRHQSAQP